MIHTIARRADLRRRIAIAVEERRLTVDGVVVALEPRVFDVLVHLARRRPSIVGESELCDSVWRASATKPRRLANYIKKARRALSCEPDAEYIRTIYGRGYQFVGQVEWGDPCRPRQQSQTDRPNA